MKSLKLVALLGLLLLVQMSWAIPSAEAGPLLDWIRGLRDRSCLNRNAAQPCGVAAAPACGLQPGQCQVTCQQTCSRTVVNYVPQTAYRTSWEKTPVTTYRPVTSSDPCTGCTVTCMKPCTNYTWQMKQIPYTTYRPVYRQESYKVPVSYVTQDCNTCNTCPTCEVPAATTAPTAMTVPGCSTCNISPTTTLSNSGVVVPSGTIGSDGVYTAAPQYMPTPAQDVPADLPPSLNPQSYRQRVLDGARNISQVPAPRSAQSPILNTWDYSPVRLASYQEPAKTKRDVVKTSSFGSFKQATQTPAKVNINANAGWKSKNW